MNLKRHLAKWSVLLIIGIINMAFIGCAENFNYKNTPTKMPDIQTPTIILSPKPTVALSDDLTTPTSYSVENEVTSTTISPTPTPTEKPTPVYNSKDVTFEQFIDMVFQIAQNEPVDAEDELGHTKYAAMFDDPASEWCTEFAVWSLLQADKVLGTKYHKLYPYAAGANYCVEWFTEKGRFHFKSDYLPKRGDMILFDYTDDGEADHTGLVMDVIVDGDKVTINTLEGNLPEEYPNGKIVKRELDSNWKKILGYGSPY